MKIFSKFEFASAKYATELQFILFVVFYTVSKLAEFVTPDNKVCAWQ